MHVFWRMNVIYDWRNDLWRQVFESNILCFTPFFQLLGNDNNATDIFMGHIVFRNSWCVYHGHMLTSKGSLNLQFTWEKQGKSGFLVNLLLHFFSFIADKIIRRPNTKKFCIYKHIALAIINFRSWLCSSFLWFFIFYANLWFYLAPYRWTNLKFWIISTDYF